MTATRIHEATITTQQSTKMQRKCSRTATKPPWRGAREGRKAANGGRRSLHHALFAPYLPTTRLAFNAVPGVLSSSLPRVASSSSEHRLKQQVWLGVADGPNAILAMVQKRRRILRRPKSRSRVRFGFGARFSQRVFDLRVEEIAL